jgi:hypothetical protein
MAARPESDPALIAMKPDAAKRLARDILENGLVSFSTHAKVEMEKDGLESTDIVNLLRGGVFEPPEIVNSELRYKATTQRMTVVFTFNSIERLRVITAWRNQ